MTCSREVAGRNPVCGSNLLIIAFDLGYREPTPALRMRAWLRNAHAEVMPNRDASLPCKLSADRAATAILNLPCVFENLLRSRPRADVAADLLMRDL